jgi:peptidase E
MPKIINHQSENNIDWASFDLIVIPGGETEVLKESLLKYNFSLDKCKQDALIIGDSAGAYILSKYYLGKRTVGDNINEYYLLEGLNPNSNILTVGHIDNPKHATEDKLIKARDFATKLNLDLLLLKENKDATYIDGKRQIE